MLRTLYGKLAAGVLVLFVVIGALVVYAFERMLERGRLFELASWLAVGGVAFALLAGLVVFRLLTRRLAALAQTVDEMRAGGFRRPVPVPYADARGDEIARLAAAVQQMSERLAAQLAELEDTQTRRRELLANVSHDLRTPLTSMRGYLETLLLKEASLSPEDRHNYLHVAVRQSERLGRLVDDLFQLTKLEADEVRARPEAFPLAELAQDVAQKFELRAQRKGIRIETAAGEGLPPALADIGLVERLLENLIENALRHTPERGVVRIGVAAAGARLHVTVVDTGSGIPAEDLPRVFERYYRAARHGDEDGAGTGLGLAIAQRIVLLHGGALEVDSRAGAGTRFRFDLPSATT